MASIEQKDGMSAAVEVVDFQVPVQARGRACGKRKRQLAVGAVDWRRSGGGKTIAVVGFDEAASGGQGGQPLIEAGGADAAAPTQFGECKRTGGLGECGGCAVVDGGLRRGLRVGGGAYLGRPRVGAVGGDGRQRGDGGGGRTA